MLLSSSKKILFFIVVVTLLLALGAWFYFTKNFSDFKPVVVNENFTGSKDVFTGEVNQNTGVQKIDVYTGGDYLVFTSALIKSDSKGCEKIENYVLKNVCFENTSKKITDVKASVDSAVFFSKDTRFCDILSGSKLKDECMKKIEVTSNFDQALNSCVAKKSQDSCDKLLNSENKNFCKKRCNELIELDSLLIEYKKSSDPKICDKATTKSVADECKKSLEFSVEFDKVVEEAKKENNVKICAKLTNNYLVEDCVKVFNTNR